MFLLRNKSIQNTKVTKLPLSTIGAVIVQLRRTAVTCWDMRGGGSYEGGGVCWAMMGGGV